jgi:hypothetical protein
MLPHGLEMTFCPDDDAYLFEQHEIELLTMGVREPEALVSAEKESRGIIELPHIPLSRLETGYGCLMDSGDGYAAHWKLLCNALSVEEICQVIKEHDGHCFLDVMMAPELEQHREILAAGDERRMSAAVEIVEAITELELARGHCE